MWASPLYVDKYACLLLYTRSIIYPHPTKAICGDPPLIFMENAYRNISYLFWQVSSSHSQAYSPEYLFFQYGWAQQLGGGDMMHACELIPLKSDSQDMSFVQVWILSNYLNHSI